MYSCHLWAKAEEFFIIEWTLNRIITTNVKLALISSVTYYSSKSRTRGLKAKRTDMTAKHREEKRLIEYACSISLAIFNLFFSLLPIFFSHSSLMYPSWQYMISLPNFFGAISLFYSFGSFSFLLIIFVVISLAFTFFWHCFPF